MMINRIAAFLLSLIVCTSSNVFAEDNELDENPVQQAEPLVGSWSFSGKVMNESGDLYGYFFQMQRQGIHFQVKTGLIDGQTNELILFYEKSGDIADSNRLNWRVGRSFIRYNPINDSWVFGLTVEENKGFNFKVDMLKQANSENHDSLILRPGVELQALQTSQLNGHIHTGADNKEQFVTGNNAWFGKIWFSQMQHTPHDISTTFCRLSNDNGFYSANLKEADATGAAIAGWRDAAGKKVKMSQFISIKTLPDNQCLLSVGLPKLNLKVENTLAQNEPFSVAGFSKTNPKDFCYLTKQSFLQLSEVSA